MQKRTPLAWEISSDRSFLAVAPHFLGFDIAPPTCLGSDPRSCLFRTDSVSRFGSLFFNFLLFLFLPQIPGLCGVHLVTGVSLLHDTTNDLLKLPTYLTWLALRSRPA
jgi:hypothetical protein